MFILIKGMTPPEKCYICHLCKGTDYGRANCLVDDKFRDASRPDDCPLIIIPEHVRLIDAGAFADRIMEQAERYWNLLRPETQKIIQNICNDIRNYPTVFEAGGEEAANSEPRLDNFSKTIKALIPASDEEQTREEKLISHCNEYWLKHNGCKECPFKGKECREFLDKYHDTPFLYVRDRKESVTDEQN